MKLMLVGIGPYAKANYLPRLAELRSTYPVDLVLAVELKEKEEQATRTLDSTPFRPELLLVQPFHTRMPEETKSRLNNAIREKGVEGVIISTEPLSHKAYAEWALEQELHILMDKPISTRTNAVTDPQEAAGIYRDYMDLLCGYNKLQEKKDTVFSISVQRRFHPGFLLIHELLREVAEKTNCPITSIQSMHCDGQWRLPSEIVTQNYHPYNCGYGKVSHSGAHFFDLAYCLYKVSTITGKMADSAEVFSSFAQPSGFLLQLNESDYAHLFGPQYSSVKLFSDSELSRLYKGFGEMDAFSIVRLLKEDEVICNVSINLLHNGFARRTWIEPGHDLYKGNGRVKHEYHSIQQGPFQNVQVHSYQSNDRVENHARNDDGVGGKNHFDILVFRNCGMTGDRKPFEVIHANEINPEDCRLNSEQARDAVVREFLQFLSGEIRKTELKSNIDDHKIPVQIMSSIYLSHIMQNCGRDPIVKFNIE